MYHILCMRAKQQGNVAGGYRFSRKRTGQKPADGSVGLKTIEAMKAVKK